MTTPAGVWTGSFQGYPFPPDVVARILNLLIEGAPFAASLTRQPTARSSIAWPTAKPTGFAWLPELAPFPVVGLDDDAYVVAIAKIGGIVDLSNESVSDNAINRTAGLATILQDSLSRDLDLGLLEGSGPPEPVGVYGVAPSALGADLLAQVTAAKGAIGDAGGTPTALAINATALAAEDSKLATTSGNLLYPGGFAAHVGLTPVVVPALPQPLVYDQSRCYLAVRNDAMVEASRDWHFNLDATSIRVKARVAAAIPDPNKGIRKLSVTAERASDSGKK
jgi:HK97 family phage major capsid protein